jgi:hypothetical protein
MDVSLFHSSFAHSTGGKCIRKSQSKDAKQNMDRVDYLKPSFPADVFTGTAAYYFWYRVL